ncbi:hypothetical protein C8R46DRAFT_816412, partial [Mycena filopes]
DAVVTVRWAPGHVGIPGNERADEEARKAAQIGSSPERDIPTVFRGVLPWSKSAIRQRYMADLKATVARDWSKSPRFARLNRYDKKLLRGSYLDTADRLPR